MDILDKKRPKRGGLEPGTSNTKIDTNRSLRSVKNKKNILDYNSVNELTSAPLHITRKRKSHKRQQNRLLF